MTARRAFDIGSSAITLVLVSPLLLVTMLAIYLTDGGPVLFRQERIGWMGRPFRMLKFRSMRVNSMLQDADTEIHRGHPLVTPVGGIIRRLKIDELPQIINVLLGDMSVFGPRPTVREQVERYTVFQRGRLAVRPGLTGWSQVNGGIHLSWPERIVLDVWYVEHRNFLLDVAIFFRTWGVIFGGERRHRKALEKAMAYARTQASPSEVDFMPAKREVMHA